MTGSPGAGPSGRRLRLGNTPDLNPRGNLREVIQQELDSEELSTSVQQLTERLKSAWAKIARYAGAYCVEHAESGGKSVALPGEHIGIH